MATTTKGKPASGSKVKECFTAWLKAMNGGEKNRPLAKYGSKVEAMRPAPAR
jgi:hypothetical protein